MLSPLAVTLSWMLEAAAAPPAKTDEPRIADAADAEYYAATGRAAAAARWYRDRMEAEPARAEWVIGWLDTLGRLPDERSRFLSEPALPEPHLAGAVTARVIGLRAMDRAVSDDAFPDRAGPWCEEALEMLDQPSDVDRTLLRSRISAKEACGASAAADRAELAALSLAPYAERADTGALRKVLDAEPWRIAELASYARPDQPNAELRVFVLDRARATAIDRQPSRIAAAIEVLEAAGVYFEEMDARRLLNMKDNGNGENRSEMRRPRPPSAANVRWIPQTVPDPPAMPPAAKSRRDRERQEALVAQLNAAVAFDDRPAVLQVRQELWEMHRDVPTALAFADAAVRDEITPEARTALDTALETLRAGRTSDEAHREALAKALDLRAKFHNHDREVDRAIASYEQAVETGGPNLGRLHQIAVLSHMSGRWADAVPAYAAAIAHPETPSHVQPHMRFWLARSIERSGGVYEGGVDALIAAYTPGSGPSELASRPEYIAPAPVRVAAAPPEEREPRPELRDAPWDIPVTVDGRSIPLGEIDGPVVVDVWATWCGPCTSTMHQFEAFAALHADDATFVLLSVDDDPAVAERFLTKRGHDGVVLGYGGPEAMEQLGVRGIPAYLVLDGEARSSAQISGWKPEQLDEALNRVVER
jgi:thiol-disulfide isomerase/thioredoxin